MHQDYDLWADPDGELHAAIELISFDDIRRGTFGPPRLYLLQGKVWIEEYSDWSYWCTLGEGTK